MELEVLHEAPVGDARGPPLLFVHGAWHGAWCWQNFLPYFARRGHPASALSLRGHGASRSARPLRKLGIRDYVEDVAQVVAGLPSPPVLVGHSMGAFVVQHLLQRQPAAGAVLLASVPPRGAWRATWHAARRHPGAFARVNLQRRLYPMVETVARARDVLFSRETPAERVAELHPRLQDESYRAYLQMLFVPVRRRPAAPCPVLVLGAAEDALIDTADVRATARFHGSEAEVLPGLGHDLMLEPRWEAAAGRVAAWLHRHGLGPPWGP